jgi:hypothetical protein
MIFLASGDRLATILARAARSVLSLVNQALRKTSPE